MRPASTWARKLNLVAGPIVERQVEDRPASRGLVLMPVMLVVRVFIATTPAMQPRLSDYNALCVSHHQLTPWPIGALSIQVNTPECGRDAGHQ